MILVAAGALFLAWQVVRTSAVDASLRRKPQVALIVAPDNPRVKLRIAMLEFRARFGQVSPSSKKAAMSALASAPLSNEPFLLGAVDAFVAKRDAEGEKLLVEARRRDPRERTARLLLLDRYLRGNRIDEAGGEVAVLHRLIPRSAEVLIPELARMVREPRTESAMIRALRRDPEMQQAVLAKLATDGADPNLILRAAGGLAPTRDGLPWQRLLLAKLIEKGDVARAYKLWRGFAGLGPGGDTQLIYDPAFRGLPGATPFNWLLVSGPAGAAERTGKGSLEVQYYGREPIELASQVLMLTPGRYRLRFRAEGEAKGQGSRLAWTISCRGSTGDPLAQIVLRGITYNPRAVAAEFAVPQGCGAQWLKLTGTPGDIAEPQNVVISALQLEPAAAR